MTSAFAEEGAFSAKAWINGALRAAAEGDATDAAPGGGAAMRLSVLLTKLQLAAADVNDEVDRRCVELSSMGPTIARELGLVREQAGSVRAELHTLLNEVCSLKDSAEAYQLVEQVVLAFWRSEEMPDEWEARLLTHLPREPAAGGSGGAAGEFHTQGKYRGIRMLELCYKIVANVLIERSSSASS